jgi:hypothetical protein
MFFRPAAMPADRFWRLPDICVLSIGGSPWIDASSAWSTGSGLCCSDSVSEVQRSSVEARVCRTIVSPRTSLTIGATTVADW